MSPLRAELSNCGWDLYGDFADATLIAENNKEWVDGVRNSNEEEAAAAHAAQLCRLRNRVSQTDRFINFPLHHEGEYCEVEYDEAKKLAPARQTENSLFRQIIRFREYGERIQHLISSKGFNYPKDRFDKDKEAQVGAAMGIWLCGKLIV